MRYTGESRQRLFRQPVPQFDFPIYKGVFTDICFCFLALILRSWSPLLR